jgi:hypothetical protein
MNIIPTVVTVHGTDALEKAIARELDAEADDSLEKLIAASEDYPAKPKDGETHE